MPDQIVIPLFQAEQASRDQNTKKTKEESKEGEQGTDQVAFMQGMYFIHELPLQLASMLGALGGEGGSPELSGLMNMFGGADGIESKKEIYFGIHG